jgi:hypothetical protein
MSDASANQAYGALNEGLYIAGFTFERAMASLLALLKDDGWRQVGHGFTDVNEFVRSLHLDQFKVVADQRKEFARRVRGFSPSPIAPSPMRSGSAIRRSSRVSFLDSVLENIHAEVSRFKRDYKLRSFAREESGRLIRFHEDASTVTPSWILATGEYVQTGHQASLLLLADGNFTVSRSVPMKAVEKATP